MHHMLSEIREQPDIIRRVLEFERENALSLAEEIQERQIRAIMIAARGTSDNAATYAKYVFEVEDELPVFSATPSVYTVYGAKPNLSHTLALGISQSGEAPDVLQVLKTAEECGAVIGGITNSRESPLAERVNHLFLCHAGKEFSVAATKTYTSSLAILALIAGYLKDDGKFLAELERVPELMEKVLALEPEIASKVERYRYMNECVILGRGFNHCTTIEADLKLSETCYMVAQPYSSAEFMHGPIAVINEGFPCFLYAPDGTTFPGMLTLAEKLKERGAEMIIVAHDDRILSYAKTPIKIPFEVAEILSPMIYILVGQIFAYYLSVTRGYNPDQPRGLKKVTKTR